MPETTRKPRRLVAALVFAVLSALVAASGAGAAPYGEIGHFGSKGTGKGQFSLFPEETDGLGVDPTDNSVYVVDLPDEKNEFRLQKFSTNEKGEFTFVASAKFKPKDPSGSEEADTVEGVAVDPAMHRVYLLALAEREKPEQIDFQKEAASELFAFSTEQKGEELTPIGSEGGVVAGVKVLKPQANKFEESLLEPTGIAVEPIDATHDNVIILGALDTGKKNEHLQPIVHNAAWWVSSEGKLTERRFVDTGEVLEDEATSPVVFNKKLFAEGEEGLYEIPSSGAPKPFTNATLEQNEFYEEQLLWQTPSIQFPSYGGGLSVGPEGTFWSTSSIRLAVGKNISYPGASSWTSTGALLGWTGGQSPANGLEKCQISVFGTPLVAAGKEWTPGGGHVMFMLDTTSKAPRLIQFGPGGTGCQPAEASKPAASVLEVPVEEGQQIPIADAVEFRSTVTQGNALSVEWNWGDGSSPTLISALEEQQTEATHKFATGGSHEVTETIHTDDLASPTVVVKSTVSIAAAGPKATTGGAASVSSSAEIVKGAVNPNGSNTTCLFEYGKNTEYGKTVPCAKQPGSGSSETAVEAEVGGLEEHTAYHYRLVAENEAHVKAQGADKEFLTAGSGQIAPKVKTEPAGAIGQTTATLNANVNAEGSSSECKFEYGTTTAYGKTTACTPNPVTGSVETSVSAAVGGLTAGTIYHFRVVAKNANPTASEGADAELKTESAGGPEKPSVKTEPAGAPGETTVTLNAKVNPHGSAAECEFQYGTTTSYGRHQACSPNPVSGSTEAAVSANVTGLTPGTVYHFRVVAKNANPTAADGLDESLTTASEPTPTPTPTPTTTTTTTPPPVEKHEVLPSREAAPEAKIAGSSLSVTSAGALTLKISCPAGAGQCAGSVVLKTAGAVAATVSRTGGSLAALISSAIGDASALAGAGGHAAKAHAAILTLATGSFTVVAGQSKTVTLHLSAKARRLLAKLHTIRAKATISAHNLSGATHTTVSSVVLKAAKKKK